MPDNATDQTTQESPVQDNTATPAVTPIDQKLRDYSDQRVQNEQYQQSQALANRSKPYFDVSASKAMLNSGPDESSLTNQYDKFKPIAYNAQSFERYYTHPLYSKLGFDPFRDNDQEYNSKSTGWQDFERMSHQWAGLAMVGLRSMNPLQNPLSTTPDVKDANEMNAKMALGASTRPGTGSALTNFALNTGYIAGIAGEFLGEEAVLAGATALTGGLDAPITSMLMGSKVAKVSKTMAEGFDAIKDFFNTANDVFKASRATGDAGRVARAALDFINPAENLTNVFREAKMKSGASDFLLDFANIKDSAGALWRDAREIRLVTSMATLGGGDVYTKVKNDLYNQYNIDHGQDPDDNTAKDYEKRAAAAAHADVLANIPLIFATNRLVFDTALKGILPVTPNTAAAMAEAGSRIIGKGVDEAGKQTFERVSSYSFKGMADAIKPINIAKHGFKYALENVGLGTMMTAQDAISQAASDYYEQPNLDPSVQGHKSYMASIASGAQAQLSSQGLGTFASGFFMKAALEGPQHLIFNAIPHSIYKSLVGVGSSLMPESTFFQDAASKIAEHNKAVEEYKTNTLNAYNAVGMDPLMAINAVDRNFMKQQESKDNASAAMLRGDRKSATDAQQEGIFHHIYTLLNAGQENMLKDHVKALNQMDDKSLANAMEMPNATPEQIKTMRDGLNDFGEKVDKIRDKYDYYNKNILNPYSAYPTKGTDQERQLERSSHDLVEYVKQIGTFSRYDFDNTLSRMDAAADNLSKDKPVTKAPFSDFKVLFDQDMRKHEIQTLNDEATLFQEGTAEDKKTAKQKRDKLVALTDLHNSILDHQESFTKGQEEVNSTTKSLFDNYRRYVHTLADQNKQPVLDENINASFQHIKDFFAIDNDHLKAAKAINIMADPEFLSGYLKRASDLAEARKEKTPDDRKAALDIFMQRKENNDFMNALYDIGAYVHPTDIDTLTNNNQTPHSFYDVQTHDIIKPDSDKMKKVMDLVETYEKTKQGKAAETPPKTEGAAPTKTKPTEDKRSHEDLAKQYGFDTKRPSQVAVHTVLHALVSSGYTSPGERILAGRLSSILPVSTSVTFSNTNTTPGSYDPRTGITIDARYSSNNYIGGVTPIEHVILHELLHKVMTDGISTDIKFNDSLTSIREQIKDPSIKTNQDLINKLLTDHDFQDYLSRIPSGGKSLLADLLDSSRNYLSRLLKTDPSSTGLDAAINIITTKVDQAVQTKVPGTTQTQATVQPTRGPVSDNTPVSNLPPELKAILVSKFNDWNDKAPSDISSDVSELSDYEISLSPPFQRWYLSNPLKDQAIAEYNSTVSPEIPEEEEEPKQEITTSQAIPQGAGKAPPTIIAGTTIVEHGQDTATAKEIENGVKDTNLTKVGKEEAEQLGQWAKATHKTAVEVSTVERAHQTGEIIARIADIPLKTNPNLETWNIGEYDGKPEGTFNEKQWVISNEEVPKGEKFSDFTDRMQRAYIDATLASPDTLMVAHSKVTRSLTALKETAGKWNDETTRLFLDEPEKKELDPSWEGKIVYMSPGSGKTTFAKSHANVIDADDVIVEVLRQRPGDYKTMSREDLLKTYRDAVTDAKIKAKLKELAAEGNTVLMGTTKYMDIADKVFTSKNDAVLLGERFKTQADLDRFRKKEQDALKRFNKIPQEFTGFAEDELSKSFIQPPEKTIFAEAQVEKSIQERINQAKDMADIQDITYDVISQLKSGVGDYDYRSFASMIAKKEAELSRTPNFEDINAGDILIMQNKNFFPDNGRAVVAKKTGSRLEVIALGGGQTVHYVKKEDLANYVEHQTKRVMPQPSNITSDEEALLNASKKNVQAQENNPANKSAIDEAKSNPKNDGEAADELFKETEC